MPTIRPAGFTAADNDALSNLKFSVVPARGAIINLWASCAANGGTMGLSIGDRDILVQGSEVNVEVSADVIDVQRDQIVFNERVNGGQLFLPIGNAGTEFQFMLHLAYL